MVRKLSLMKIKLLLIIFTLIFGLLFVSSIWNIAKADVTIDEFPRAGGLAERDNKHALGNGLVDWGSALIGSNYPEDRITLWFLL